MAWRWQWQPAGATVPDDVSMPESWPTQSDAESWIGEHWRVLRRGGIEAASLYDDDRRVYGPMRLEV